jgi:tripartite-type tricarboxylate transporter receptor subunit TctC
MRGDIVTVRSTAGVLAIAAALAWTGGARAQTESWPAKPVRIVSAMTPGGLSDVLARIVAQHLEGKLNGKFVVENRPGGGGVIGAVYVAEQPPDGLALCISGTGSHVIAPALNPNVGFDTMKSFTHIAFLGGSPTMLIVSPALGVSTLAEFAALAKTRGGLPFGSSGTGTHGHLIGELFASTAAVPLTHIPYRGANVAVTDVMAGHIAAAFVTTSSASQQVRAGNVKAIAVTSSERLPQFPDVPTFRELGYPDLVALTWFALCGPAGMPKEIVAKLNAAAIEAMTSPAVARQLESEAIEVLRLSPEDFTAFVQAEIDRWGPIARRIGKTP